MQDTFIKLATKKPVFRGKSSFKTWLYAIGRNIAKNHIRSLVRHNDILLEECENITDELDLERNYLVEEQKIMLHHTIRRLKQDYQQVLYLTYFENFSNAETAEIMKKSKRQIENLLYNAKKSLKAELEKEGFRYEEL